MATTLVLFPPITTLFHGYLGAQLTDATPVVKLVPNPAPTRFVLVVASASHESGYLTGWRNVIVQAHDQLPDAAEQLAEQCFAIVQASQFDHSLPAIRKIRAASTPHWFPDPDLGKSVARYQFAFSALVRGTPT